MVHNLVIDGVSCDDNKTMKDHIISYYGELNGETIM